MMAALISHLIPIDNFISGFTTSNALDLPNVTCLPLDDVALGVHKVSSRTSHPVVTPPIFSLEQSPQFIMTGLSSNMPPPDSAWLATYPEGSINPSSPIPGGFGFYLSGPPSFTDLLDAGAREVVMSYRLMFEEGWDWVKGGKLPGMYGGEGDLAYTCTGGRQTDRCKCFNSRPMWRANATSEIYLYAPLTDNNDSRLSKVPPYSKKNPDYGYSVGRGAFNLSRAVGSWQSIALRTKLNTVGAEDGEIQLWIDGESVINATGLTLRGSESGKIKGMHFQTFFGGHTPDWASPREQRAWFADITGIVVE